MNRETALKVMNALVDDDYSCTVVAAVIPPKFRTPETGAVNHFVKLLGPRPGVRTFDLRALLALADAHGVELLLATDRAEVLFESPRPAAS